jgi:hypothetical protein
MAISRAGKVTQMFKPNIVNEINCSLGFSPEPDQSWWEEVWLSMNLNKYLKTPGHFVSETPFVRV